MVEQFTLRWNKFHSNVAAGFVALLQDEELVDVTLAAEGQLLKAHKLVLSICSPYFKRLFQAHPAEHPVVILKDVTLSELRDILQFMYRGEVNISQQDLSSFLHTAELLQVRGLTEHATELPDPSEIAKHAEPAEPPNATEPEPETDRTPSSPALKSAKRRRIKPEEPETAPAAESCDSQSDSDHMMIYEGETFRNVLEMIESGRDHIEQPDPDPDPDDPKQKRIKNRKIGNYKCLLCHRLFTSRYNLKIHMRDKHYSVEDTLQCHICQKRMRNPSCLRVHLYHHRKQQQANTTDISAEILERSHTDSKNIVLSEESVTT